MIPNALRILAVAVLVALLPSRARAQDCAAPTSTADVETSLAEAEAKFTNLDMDGFRRAVDQAFVALPCVREPVPRHLAASLHRWRGLRAYVDRDPDTSTRAFAAARSIEPSWTFPESLVPPGNPVLTDYAAIDPATGRLEPVPAPNDGTLYFDGRAGVERPASFPTVFQRLDGAGAVVTTRYLMPGDALPAYPPRPAGVAAADPAPLPEQAPTAERHPLRVPFVVGATAGVLGSGACYVLARRSSASYYGRDPVITDPDTLAGLRSRTNTLTVAAAVAGAAGVGLGVGAVFVAAW